MTRTLHAAWAAPLLALGLLVACASEQRFENAEALARTEHVEEALQEYRAALQKEPNNARFRIAYLNARDQAVRRWLGDAELMRRDPQRLDEARALYQRVLGIDEQNSRAQSGLSEMARERRHADLLAQARVDARQNDLSAALASLRQILTERPQHAEALALQAELLQQRGRPKAGSDARLAEAFRKPVSLEFKDAQLKQVFEVLSRSSGLNFVLDRDVRGDQRTTLFLRNSTIADALSLALLTNQLEQRVLDANTVLIFPNTANKIREYQQLSVKAFVLSSADTKTVANSLKTLLKAKDVVVDEKQNMLLMRDTPEAIELAEKLVALHDQPEAEVMLEVEILEVKRSRLRQMGIQYPSQVALAPMTAASGAQLTLSDLRHLKPSTTSVTGVNLGVQANQVNTDINVLANPRIRSRNREKAKIQVGQRVPNITSTSTSTGFVAETVQYVEVGLKLEVEPTVSPDGEVAIKVGLEVSNILRQVQTKGGSIAYEIGTRNASTVLRLRDGENQVLAGLINDEDRRTTSGLPGLVSTPGLGGTLFGNNQDDVQKSEVVLSITPRIVRSAFRPGLVLGEFSSGTEASLRSRGAELGDGGAPAAKPTGPAAGAQPASSAPPATQAPPTGSAPQPDAVPTAPLAPLAASSPAADTAPARTLEPPAAEPSAAAPDSAAQQPPDGERPANGGELYWRGGSQLAVGATVTLELRATSPQALAVVPLALHYDPRVLALQSVEQGDYMSNAGTSGSLNKRAEAGSGVVQAVLSATGGQVRPAEGALLRLVFKALSSSDATQVSVSDTVRAVTIAGQAADLSVPGAWRLRIK